MAIMNNELCEVNLNFCTNQWKHHRGVYTCYGIETRDQLTPFLFLIATKGIAGVVRHATSKNMIKRIRVGVERDIGWFFGVCRRYNIHL